MGEPAAPRLEGFVATYTEDGEPFVRLAFDGPHDRHDADLTLRPAYRLKVESLPDAQAWALREADYFDGDLQKVRSDGCGIISVGSDPICERHSVQWRHTLVGGFEVSPFGAFWSFADSADLQRRWDGDTLVVENGRQSWGNSCWVYEGTKPIPVRSCDGKIRLASYERTPLPVIAPWPAEPQRPAAGPHSNPLFPGAELDLQGHGFTSLAALDALTATSTEARAKLERGGCVVTTLFGRGSGGFGTDPVTNQLESAPMAHTSFTLQEGDGTGRVKYTLRWVEDRLTGERRFSQTVDTNSPDHQGGPTCSEARAMPWPAVPLGEFLSFAEARFGPHGEGSVEVSRQPHFLIAGGPLHYTFLGTAEGSWGGAGFYFDSGAGRLVHSSYISDHDLEPEQNG